jgi:hypothetical protein
MPRSAINMHALQEDTENSGRRSGLTSSGRSQKGPYGRVSVLHAGRRTCIRSRPVHGCSVSDVHGHNAGPTYRALSDAPNCPLRTENTPYHNPPTAD